MSDVFRVLREDVDVTLFKGAGDETADENVVRHLSRTGVMSRICRERLRWPRYHLEFATFAAGLFPHLVRGKFDLVHFIDPPLGLPLKWMRRMMRKKFGLLFTNAGPRAFDASRWVDQTHCLTPASREESISLGAPADGVTMLPVGVDSERFSPSDDRSMLRKRYGVDESAFVVLAVTTLNRHHKRVDYLIEEAAMAGRELVLWIDGSLHPDGDPDLIELAKEKFGERCRITHVPSDEVRDLYRMADVMVSASLNESFGMSLVEAACCGTPVIAHEAPHFRWLLGDAGRFVDMRWPGKLAAGLRDVMDRRVESRGTDVASRFGWDALKAGYLEMYRTAARGITTEDADVVASAKPQAAGV
jgi:glycosyltransferase involved in cell wall biosynthesis